MKESVSYSMIPYCDFTQNYVAIRITGYILHRPNKRNKPLSVILAQVAAVPSPWDMLAMYNRKAILPKANLPCYRVGSFPIGSKLAMLVRSSNDFSPTEHQITSVHGLFFN